MIADHLRYRSGFLRLSAIELGFLAIPLVYGSGFAEGPWAWKWLCIYGLSIVIALRLFVYRAEKRVTLNKTYFVLIGALIGSFFCSIFLNNQGAYETQILDWCCFALIALATAHSWNLESFEKILKINSLTTALLLFIALVESLSIPPGEPPSVTFGHQNMFAEYLAISIILQSHGFFFRKGQNHRNAHIILLVSSLMVFIWLQSRSAMVALSASTIVLVLACAKECRIQKYTLSGIVVTLSFACIHFVVIAGNDAKLRSTGFRLTRWANTLEMIKQKPGGVGPGRFEFGYLPYRKAIAEDYEANEHTIIKSPHNGYLEAAAECGIVFLCVLMVLIFYVFRRAWLLKQRQSDTESKLILGILTFITVDALFAFPMENPYPFFVMAVMTGVLIRLEHSTAPRALNNVWYRLAFASAALPVMVYAPLMATARTLEITTGEFPVLTRFVCTKMPSHWPLCLKEAQQYLQKGQTAQAFASAQKILNHTPWHFPAVALQIEATYALNDRERSCLLMQRYEDLIGLSAQGKLLKDLRCLHTAP